MKECVYYVYIVYNNPEQSLDKPAKGYVMPAPTPDHKQWQKVMLAMFLWERITKVAVVTPDAKHLYAKLLPDDQATIFYGPDAENPLESQGQVRTLHLEESTTVFGYEWRFVRQVGGEYDGRFFLFFRLATDLPHAGTGA